jgi:hypothetical protein
MSSLPVTAGSAVSASQSLGEKFSEQVVHSPHPGTLNDEVWLVGELLRQGEFRGIEESAAASRATRSSTRGVIFGVIHSALPRALFH